MDSNLSHTPIHTPYTIVFASNEKGVLPLSLALWSLLKRASDTTTYDVYILSDGISPESQKRLQDISAGIHARHQLNFVDAGPVLDEKIEEKYAFYLPRSAWARIFIPDLIPHATRALYVDIDILVCDDCAPLFEVDMQGAAIGAVYESASSEENRANQRLDIPVNYPGYFNSGVLLMDLEVFRRDHLSERVMQFAADYSDKLEAKDQDALNAALYQRVFRLHPRWNWHDGHTRRFLKANPDNRMWKSYEPREVVEASLYPGILHFIGFHKPWNYNHRIMRKKYEDAIRESGLPGFFPIPGWNFKTWLTRILYAPMYALTWLKIQRLAKKWGVTNEPKVTTWGVAEDISRKGWPPQA